MMLKNILILILLVVSSHSSWATNPMILNLADKKMVDSNRYDEALDCWNDAGDFLNLKCEKKIHECKFEEILTTGYPVSVKVNLQSSFVKKANGFLSIGIHGQYDKSDLSVSFPSPWTTLKAPPGSEVVVYDFNNSGFDIYDRVKIPLDGVVQLTNNTILPAHQEFYISMGKNWPKDANLSASLLGHNIGKVTEGGQIYFKLAEGDYFLYLQGDAGGNSYKMYYPLSVTKEKNEAYRIQIDFNELIDTFDIRFPHHELVLNNNKLSYKFLSTNSRDVNFEFEEVSSVTINKKLAIENFKVQESNIEISDTHFREFIKDSPIFIIDIKGKCATNHNRIPLKSYPVFSKPNANKMGDIHIFSTNYELQSFYEKLQSNSYQEFKSNLDVGHDVFYYQAVSSDDGFVNLGEGVWGNEGWIKVPLSSFFSLHGMFYLKGKTDKEYVEYFRSYNNDLYKRTVSKNAFNRDSFFSGVIVKTEDSELLNENDVLKIPIIDREGSNRNNMDVPKLVDLTNGEISIRGTVKSSRIALYKEPRDDSSIEGFLEFSYEDDLLKGYYLSVSDKKNRIPFTSDYYQGRCSGYFEYSALNNVEDVFNEYSQIGEGPWGKKAWVKSRRFDVGDKRLPVNILYKDKHVLQDINYYGKNEFRIYYKKNSYVQDMMIKIDDIRSANKVVLKPYCFNDDKINLSQVVEPRYISILPDSMDKFKPSNNCSSLESISSLKKCKPLQEYSIKLFEKPYIGSKNAGEILAIFDPSIRNEGSVRLIYRKDGVDHKFETNFYGDYCSSKHLYLQLVWGSVDGWANLGEGLWGKEGWVNIEPTPVIGENGQLHYFFDNSYYSVSFEHGEDGEILMKDRRLELDDIELRIEDILYPSGLMRFKIDCESGC